MVIEKVTDLGEDALRNPKKYNGFMGITIRNRFFTKETMLEYIRWCSNQFNEFVIFLMDDPDQYNLMVFKELKKKQALEKARNISDYTKSALRKILNGQQMRNIKILQFRDFNNDPLFLRISLIVKKLIRNDKVFKDSLYTLMETIVGKKINDFIQKKKLSGEKIERIKKILFRYTTEEIVAVIYFTEKGYPIEIDPTPEFLVKSLLYEDRFPKFFHLMKLGERGHIFMHPKESFIKS